MKPVLTSNNIMMNSIIRNPDLILGANENTDFRFEEKKNRSECPVKHEISITDKELKVTVLPDSTPILFLKLRWNCDFSQVNSVFGDDWERVSATHAPLEWKSVMPYRPLPWFCALRESDNTYCYGVKTGCNSFAFFQVDSNGISLFLNLMSGSHGTIVKEPFVACELVEYSGNEGESVYSSLKTFMRILCDKPILPKTPIFGTNNWYWAYGNISREMVLREADYLAEMTDGVKHKPSLLIDDGWQINRTSGNKYYIGGPFKYANEKFMDMAEVADRIHEKGAKPGIWFRPLLTLGYVPEEAQLGSHDGGLRLDPSHPFVLERVREDAARIRAWGYEIIKHDFSTNDVFCTSPVTVQNITFPMQNTNTVFYDRSKTTAMILKDLYKAIQEGAGDADVIGCSVVGHLSAGIHSIQRVGDDTSGRSFEWTIRNGVHSFMRLPMNNNFFKVDPDCAAFTAKVDEEMNLRFMEMCALTGSITFASVTPGILSAAGMKRINNIFKIADKDECRYGIADFEKCAIPGKLVSNDGEIADFNWSEAYDGSRVNLTWSN